MDYRVLRFPLHITIPEREQYQNIKTGYGYSVWDISRYSALRGNDEYCLPLIKNNGKQEVIEDVNILPFDPFLILENANYGHLLQSLKYAQKFSNFKENILGNTSLFFYSLSRGYFEKLTAQLDPDMIHIHGISLKNVPQIDVALRSEKPFVLTLHALSIPGSNDDFSLSTSVSKMKIRLLEYLNRKNIRISVVGSKMKENLCRYADIKNQNMIEVIPHGVDLSRFSLNRSKNSLREKYGIDESKTVFLSAGSLQKRKNYSIAIKAINKLPSEIQNNILYLIAGEGEEEENLKRLIQNNNMDEQIKLLGYIPADDIVEYFKLADGIILCSKSEGCSRPMLEGYASGTPIIIFEDLEGMEDLYNPEAMQLIENRTVEDFADAISKFIEKDWDEETIKNYAENFSWDKSVEKYEKLYEKAIKDNRKSKNEESLVQKMINDDLNL